MPGHTQLTLIFSGPCWAAIALVIWIIAPLEVGYRRLGFPPTTKTTSQLLLSVRRQQTFSLTSTNRRHVHNRSSTNPSKFWNYVTCHDYHTGDIDPKVAIPVIKINCRCIAHCPAYPNFLTYQSQSFQQADERFIPILTKMLGIPKQVTVFATAFLHDSSEVTSAWMTSEIPPSRSIMRFVSVAHSRFKSTSETFAPCRARRIAVARPLPISPESMISVYQAEIMRVRPGMREPAPVIIATSSVKSNARGGLQSIFE